jgi:hypothetical protein
MIKIAKINKIEILNSDNKWNPKIKRSKKTEITTRVNINTDHINFSSIVRRFELFFIW